MRTCNICSEEMLSGYYVDDSYYCSKACLNKEYSDEEYNELYEADSAYWTTWED